MDCCAVIASGVDHNILHKTHSSRKGRGDEPLEMEDLLTIHLDLLAAREGF
jgi:hypothetical protein